MSIIVSSQDVSDAEDFLVEYVSDNIPEGDYSDGSLLRDMAIKAVAFVFAYLKKTDAQIRARQSLKSVNEIDTSDDPEAANDAVDAIISNWFATRNQGRYARVMAYGFATERMDITITPDKIFYKTAGLPFILDNGGAALHIPAQDLVAQFDSTGAVSGYTFRIPMVSQSPGVNFNIAPGRFTSFDDFSPYVTHIETLERAQSGGNVETNAEFIERSKNLVTVRNLINARSCDAVLRDEFEDIRTVSVIGMGDVEMTRDRARDAATGFELHTGGCQDVFVELPIQETSFSGVVGARFTRPDGVINLFRDVTYADYDAVSNPAGHKFTEPDPTTALVIQAGMALRIWEGLPISARDFIVREVHDTYLLVSEKVPFPVTTDEGTTPTYVRWSIGQEMPNYQDVVPQTTTGETSKQIQTPGRIVLPGGPIYKILDVTVNDNSDPDADPTDGLIHFNVRRNTAPVAQVAPDNEYQLVVHNPEAHQSTIDFAEIFIGPDTDLTKYDGKTLKVTYETLAGFSSVANRVANRRDRIASDASIVRGYHPAYLSFVLEYKLLKSATSDIDVEEARDLLVNYINTFPSTEVIDVSLISGFFKSAYPQVGQVFPFTIAYELHVPDGRTVEFSTTEDVTVPSDVTKLSALLMDPTSTTDGLLNPLEYGLTDDVIRYLVRSDAIRITKRA